MRAIPWLFHCTLARGILCLLVHDVREGSTENVKRIAGARLSGDRFGWAPELGRGSHGFKSVVKETKGGGEWGMGVVGADGRFT
jgi:hypothetical protein